MKKFKFNINGYDFNASVNELEDNALEVNVNGSVYTVNIEKEDSAEKQVATPVQPKAPSTVSPAAAVNSTTTSVKSPLPGSIVKVLVSVGTTVKRGDVLMTIESMKMENEIAAENDGIVEAIHVTPGQSVMQDDKLLDLKISAPTATATPSPKAAAPAPAPAAPKPQAAPAPKATNGEGKAVKSPLPGSIVKILVKQGDTVKPGDVMLTIESMKMENEIMAEFGGTVKSINVSPSQSVMQDDVLLYLE